MRKSLVIAGAVAAISAAAPSAQAASFLTVGANDLCAKSSCFDWKNTYTQTFSGKDFSGPVSIASMQLFKSLLGDFQNNVVKISFQLADGTVIGDWGGFVVAMLGGDVVTLGGQAFTWDPSMGDLVVKLDAIAPGRGGFGGGGALGAPLGGGGGFGGFGGGGFGPPSFSHAPSQASLNAPVFAAAEVDSPALAAASAPEPSTWALAIGGFLAVGAVARRRRRDQFA